MNNFKYPWPASALGSEEMTLLHSARESPEADTKVPITKLIANAIRTVYGTSTNNQT